MAENVFTQRFCDIVKKQICTTTADLNFDNYTAAGTYEIYESLDNGQNRVYFLTVDKSADGNCTQTRTYCGKVEYRNCTNEKWSEWESKTVEGIEKDFADLKSNIDQIITTETVDVPATRNKFNVAAAEVGLLKEGKVNSAYDTRITSDFIAFTNGQKYLLNRFVGGLSNLSMYALCYYDENKNYISAGDTTSNVLNCEGAKFIRFTCSISYKDVAILFIEDGDIDTSDVTEFIPYGEAKTEEHCQLNEDMITPYLEGIEEEVSALSEYIDTFDLLPKAIEKTNEYIKEDKTIAASGSWTMYKFATVGVKKIVNLVCYADRATRYAVGFYSDNDEFISGLTFKISGRNVFESIDLTEYPSASYIRIATRTATNAEFSVFGVEENHIPKLADDVSELRKDFEAEKEYNGELKAVYTDDKTDANYVENFTFSNDSTIVGDEIWCAKSPDATNKPDETEIRRFTIEDGKLVYKASVFANFGHCNCFNYNPANDCFIFGNGGGTYDTTTHFFAVVPRTNILSGVTDESGNITVNFDDVAIKYPVPVAEGDAFKDCYKLQAVWGDSNCGKHNGVILFANYGGTIDANGVAQEPGRNSSTKIYPVLLKKNADGTFYKDAEAKGAYTHCKYENGEIINGTITPGFGVQGATYYGGNFYINHAKNGATSVACISMSDYSVTNKTRYFYDDNGELYNTGGPQGIVVDNKYEYWFVNRGKGGVTKKFLLQYHR